MPDILHPLQLLSLQLTLTQAFRPLTLTTSPFFTVSLINISSNLIFYKFTTFICNKNRTVFKNN